MEKIKIKNIKRKKTIEEIREIIGSDEQEVVTIENIDLSFEEFSGIYDTDYKATCREDFITVDDNIDKKYLFVKKHEFRTSEKVGVEYNYCSIKGNLIIDKSTDLDVLYVYGDLIVKPETHLNVELLFVSGNVISEGYISVSYFYVKSNFSTKVLTIKDYLKLINCYSKENCAGNLCIGKLIETTKGYCTIKINSKNNIQLLELYPGKMTLNAVKNCYIEKIISKEDSTHNVEVIECESLNVNSNISSVNRIRCDKLEVKGDIKAKTINVNGDYIVSGITTADEVTIYGDIKAPRIDTWNLKTYRHYFTTK